MQNEIVRMELRGDDAKRFVYTSGRGGVGDFLQEKLPKGTRFVRISNSMFSSLFKVWKLEVEVERRGN